MTVLLTAALVPALCLSLLYWVVVWWCVRRFFGCRPYAPGSAVPAVSVLKPVKGLDPDAYENFASFCRQDYPDYEILFGMADADDPAAAVVERLRADFPRCKIGLVHVPPGGRNPKCASLHELAARAGGEVLVVNDADIRAAPDYLRRVTAPLQDPRVGAVTCPYASRPADTLPSRLEALHLDGEFLPSAIFAHEALGVPVGLGATIAVRRRDLLRAGGYAAVADYLADDYQIVARIARMGYRVVLSRCVVTHVLGDADFRGQWDQEVRWALAVRSCSPWGYLGLALTYTTPLALGLAAAMHFSAAALGLAAAAVGARVALAWGMQAHLSARKGWQCLAWLPARECLSLFVWAAGLCGRRVAWRGQVFALRTDGRLEPSR